MTMFSQGEKLMVLVKRDDRMEKDIAKSLGVGRTYLPRLYKLQFLPIRIIELAVREFGVNSNYFDQEVDVVAEDSPKYYTESMRDEVERLRKENQELKAALFDKMKKDGTLPDM